MKKIHFSFLAMLLLLSSLGAQEKLTYQKPPQEILELVDVPLTPSTLVDSKAENMLFLYRDQYRSIAELSEQELRLAGLRINPATNIGSRTTFFNNIQVKQVKEQQPRQVKDLPQNARLANFSWSPDESKLAFTHTTQEGVELWVLDIPGARAKRLTEARLNANLRSPIDWFRNGEALLVKMLPSDRKELIDSKTAVPDGPTISISEGAEAQNRTYQDLLSNTNDEYNFKQLVRADLVKVNLDGKTQKWLDTDMFNSVSFSPDGEYVMVSSIKEPFSYLVPYHRFPSETKIYSKEGKEVAKVNQVPLSEVLPKGFMSTRKGKRNLQWRADQPATLVYVKALDEGDPEREVEFRDEVFQLKAPFKGEGESIFKTRDRYAGITWGDKNTAIAYDRWWNTRNSRTYVFNPSKPKQTPTVLFDRNYQDRYSDPGSFVTRKNEFGRWVLNLNRNNAFLLGDGYSKEGQFPFADQIDLKTGETKRLYQSPYKDKKETLVKALDMANGQLLVRIESATDYPNYFIRDMKAGDDLVQITRFENPFKSLENVHKEVITYKREDGLPLSGTLYLPEGYDFENPEKLPMIMWAYPREYKDRNSASQVTSNPNNFTYPSYGSPIYWVNRGYVVLDAAAFPIVGEGEEEPNDSFRKQLVANAKAAIDAVDALGYVDRNRIGVGGHSYGAFMVANLLSHSDLFAAGLSRSGAYNRTLTPFGFQSEERSYWEAPEVYYDMSPFMHADKMKTPMLIIHGEADNNSGTYPMQSERYFNALKGLGAPARLVMLPKESHGYAAKESVLHVLWEQDRWLEKYVKQKDLAHGIQNENQEIKQ